MDTIKRIASLKDHTQWLDLCPPRNKVTRTFVTERQDVMPLVCVSALLECCDETLSRGGDFPFSIGDIRTNGLATAATLVLNIASAKATLAQTMTCGEARDFVQENSTAWHVYSICRLIDSWPGNVHESYAHAKNIAAHAALAFNDTLANHALLLARACFTMSCDRLVDPPSESMKGLVFAVCTGEIHEDTCATVFPDTPQAARVELLRDVQSVFPRLIDTEVRRTTAALRTVVATPAKNKCVALCILLQAHEGLEFDV